MMIKKEKNLHNKMYRNLKFFKMIMTRMDAFTLHRCVFISFLGKPTYFLIQQWALAGILV